MFLLYRWCLACWFATLWAVGHFADLEVEEQKLVVSLLSSELYGGIHEFILWQVL